ncbi:MAG: sensor histidine kinase [Flavobacteriaceae bacterium]
MKSATPSQTRIFDKTRLLLNFNYTSVILSIVFGLSCFFFLQIREIIPYVFFAYAIINLINIAAFYRHENLTAMALATSILSFICTLIITLYSGGINSPFIFVMAIIVLAGYISTRVFGKIYLYIVLAVLVGIYLVGLKDFSFIFQAVPEVSRDLFSLFSMLFSVYLLCVTFGRNLLKAHHRLYKSKTEIEERIVEKETLLREVHHRVKNNLQTVSSLLNLQAKNTDDGHFQDLIKSSQNRVVSMAMIHEMLYMRDNLSKIEYKSYVQELGDYLIKSIKGAENKISLRIDIPNIQLGIDTAIPLGLLINEIITNSLKYGFAGGAEGVIDVAIKKRKEKNHYTLYIGDDGVGFSQTVDFTNKSSLGLRLIHNLARQLLGSVARDFSKRGTNYIIHFEDIGKRYQDVA